MQQPRWLIRSKQRAFNPIHVFFFCFFLFSSMSSLSNTIRCHMQSREEAGAGHTCLAGLQAGSWEACSQRTVGCTDGGAGKTWGKATLWLQLSAGKGPSGRCRQRNTSLVDLIQPMGGKTQKGKAEIFAKRLLCGGR